jgi:hypothetical protein
MITCVTSVTKLVNLFFGGGRMYEIIVSDLSNSPARQQDLSSWIGPMRLTEDPAGLPYKLSSRSCRAGAGLPYKLSSRSCRAGTVE